MKADVAELWERLRHLAFEADDQECLAAPEQELVDIANSLGIATSKALPDLRRNRRAFIEQCEDRSRAASQRFGKALLEAEKLRNEKRTDEIQELFNDLLSSEEIPFYRELIQNEIDRHSDA
ncbi:MAG: DUF2379 family protein [Deltaproteobacteria bacterium]|nr:DUF2379 family protein [Deltaproteobacteria bacterium]